MPKPAAPARVDIAALRSIATFGFVGGRDSCRAFCLQVFASDKPCFLRTDGNDLVVFRHCDLRKLGAIAAIAIVPAGVMFQGLTLELASADLPAEPYSPHSPPGSSIAQILSNQFFTKNPPIHGPARKMMVAQLGPKQISQIEGLARETIKALLDEPRSARTFDFLSDFCKKLTARFFAALLGMNETEKIAIAQSVRDLSPLFFMDRSPHDIERLESGSHSFRSLIETANLRTLATGKNAMLNKMADDLAGMAYDAELDGVGMVPRNLGAYMAGNLVNAFRTEALGAANTVYTLLRHPDALAQAQSPDLLPRAIFEALRLVPPMIYLRSYVIEYVEYEGVIIPKGTLVAMLWSAGNHDPKVFHDQTCSISPGSMGGTTFGGGILICPGRHVSVMLIGVMLETLDANRVRLELVDTPYTWCSSHLMAQLKAMPLRLLRKAT